MRAERPVTTSSTGLKGRASRAHAGCGRQPAAGVLASAAYASSAAGLGHCHVSTSPSTMTYSPRATPRQPRTGTAPITTGSAPHASTISRSASAGASSRPHPEPTDPLRRPRRENELVSDIWQNFDAAVGASAARRSPGRTAPRCRCAGTGRWLRHAGVGASGSNGRQRVVRDRPGDSASVRRTRARTALGGRSRQMGGRPTAAPTGCRTRRPESRGTATGQARMEGSRPARVRRPPRIRQPRRRMGPGRATGHSADRHARTRPRDGDRNARPRRRSARLTASAWHRSPRGPPRGYITGTRGRSRMATHRRTLATRPVSSALTGPTGADHGL